MDAAYHQFPNTISGKGNAPSFKQNGWTALPTARSNGHNGPSPSLRNNSSPHQNGYQVHALHENGRQDNRQLRGSPSCSPNIARRSNSNSPRVTKRQESASAHTSQVHHLTRIICNSLWGQKLTFHPYVRGDSLIPFCSLWPDGKMLVDTFREAEFNKQPFELCKLLLATSSIKSLEALLEKQVGFPSFLAPGHSSPPVFFGMYV